MARKLLIIGHGMVSQRLLQELAGRQHDWTITVIGAEPEAAYNRIMLSPLLAREIEAGELPLASTDWYHRHQIKLHLGDPVIAIDRQQRRATTAAGHPFDYDALVLATGAEAAQPVVPGARLDGVLAFRTLAHTRELQARAARGGRAVVVGGGFLGLEAAEGLRKQGMTVTVLHRNSHLLNRQLDPEAADRLTRDLRARGLAIELDASVAALEGDTAVQGVTLTDGSRLAADLVVFATGIRPNRHLAADAGLGVDQGIVVDSQLRTDDPAIHALGECAQFGGHCYGLVDPLYRQAGVLAAVLGGEGAHFSHEPVATRLKISGLQLFSCGAITPDQDTESLVLRDHDTGQYRRLLLRDNRLAGAVLYGDTRHGPWYYQHLCQGTDLTPWRDQLLFGADFCRPDAA